MAVMNDGASSEGRIRGRRSKSEGPGRGRLLARAPTLLAAVLVAVAAPASADKARLTGLSDVNFAPISNFGADARRTQSVCMFSQTDAYNVRASGSGAGGAFLLSSGGDTLTYEVEWSASPGQNSGSTLLPNSTLTGLSSTARQQECNSGPQTSASLIVILRSAALSGAIAGSYSGTLTLVVAPE